MSYYDNNTLKLDNLKRAEEELNRYIAENKDIAPEKLQQIKNELIGLRAAQEELDNIIHGGFY